MRRNAGDLDVAVALRREAAALCDEIGVQEGDQLRPQLGALTVPAPLGTPLPT